MALSTVRSRHATSRSRARQRPGFTLVELSVVIIVIVILVSLGTVAAARAVRSSRESAERLLLVSIKQGVEQFKQQFGFYPPLVKNGGVGPVPDGPIGQDATTGIVKPQVWDAAFLRSESAVALTTTQEERYSEYSLPYYLMGVLDANDMSTTSTPIDGVPGPGFTHPAEDGSFSKKGQAYGPYIDAGVRKRLVNEDSVNGRIKFVDRWYVAGVNWPAIRYYRWMPQVFDTGPNKGQVKQFMVPRVLGDPNKDENLRNAEFAIVSFGPDGQSDTRKPLPKGTGAATGTDAAPINAEFTKDDIVEVGR